MRGGRAGSDQRSFARASCKGEERLWAMMRLNEPRYFGSLRQLSRLYRKIIQWNHIDKVGVRLTRVSAVPSTLSFISSSNLTASSARFLPMLSGPSKKKLFPASTSETFSGSRIVKWPIPGRTRFLRIEVDVADAETTRMRADSSAF